MRVRHALVAGLVAIGLSPASAAATDDVPVSAVAQEIEQALHVEGLANTETSSGIDVPSDGDGDVLITPGETADGEVLVATPDLTLGLPANGDGIAVGATTVFDGDRSANQIAIQATDSGARALVHIADASAPTAYRFTLGGVASSVRGQPDGSVAVLDSNGETIATLAAPWARDADGHAIATHYELDGTDVLQVVEHRDDATRYPVVADPSVDLDPGWFTIKATFSRDITNRIAGFAVGAVGVAAGIAEACSLIPNFPLKAACKAIIAARAYNFINAARDARSHKQCLYYQAPWGLFQSGWFGRSNQDCKNR